MGAPEEEATTGGLAAGRSQDGLFGRLQAPEVGRHIGETAFLLTLGLIVGGGAALLPVLARPGGLERGPGWGSLAILFLGIFAAGMGSSVLALRSALRAPLIPALRAE